MNRVSNNNQQRQQRSASSNSDSNQQSPMNGRGGPKNINQGAKQPVKPTEQTSQLIPSQVNTLNLNEIQNPSIIQMRGRLP